MSARTTSRPVARQMAGPLRAFLEGLAKEASGRPAGRPGWALPEAHSALEARRTLATGSSASLCATPAA